MGKRPERKLAANTVLERIKAAVTNETIVYSNHAMQRMAERNISRQEVKTVLAFGFLEPRHDQLIEEVWRYAVRCDIKLTDDGTNKRRLRVPVAFDDESKTIIVTTIDLDLDT